MRRMRTVFAAIAALIAIAVTGTTPAIAGTYVLRPDGDVVSQWSRSGAPTAWEALDDPVTRPTSVGGTDYVFACAPAG